MDEGQNEFLPRLYCEIFSLSPTGLWGPDEWGSKCQGTPFHCSHFCSFNTSLSCLTACPPIAPFPTIHTNPGTTVLLTVIAKNRPGPIKRKASTNERERDRDGDAVELWTWWTGVKVHNETSPPGRSRADWTSCFHGARGKGPVVVVVVGGGLYGKRLWPAWQLCLMDGPPPSGCSACNKYPCSCLTSLTYQTHLSLLGHPWGTHNYALHSPLAGVRGRGGRWEGGVAVLFMGRSPRAKRPKKKIDSCKQCFCCRENSITSNTS